MCRDCEWVVLHWHARVNARGLSCAPLSVDTRMQPGRRLLHHVGLGRARVVIVSGLFSTPTPTRMLVPRLAFIVAADTRLNSSGAFLPRADRGNPAATTDTPHCGVKGERAL